MNRADSSGWRAKSPLQQFSQARVELTLPPWPGAAADWELLRRELSIFDCQLTVKNVRADMRPDVVVTGKRCDLREWLDQCGYKTVNF